MRLGIDTGGTFTDFVLLENGSTAPVQVRTLKVLSTPEAPEQAILQGIAELGLEAAVLAGQVQIIHGSTVATNAALEGKGVTTAYVTNRGFADVLTIARQTRPRLYQLQQAPPPVPVPPPLCFETGGRISASGETLEGLDLEDLEELTAGLQAVKPRAIAINLLFSFIDSTHEEKLLNHLEINLGWQPFICRSSAVLAEYREYERGIATWLNASLGPLMDGYLKRLKTGTAPSPLAIMQSSGGTIEASQAAEHSVNLLLSGPAGGLAAVRWLASITGEEHLMTFDMGGTSTDVALYDGQVGLTTEGVIGPWPVAVPMVDMHTIGAGGGSLAWLDAGGVLQVGPQSAGANPGPACYGHGGQQATVTDANLVLGRFGPDPALGGKLSLQNTLAVEALSGISDKLGLTYKELAEGILRVANEHMAQALRVISVARGYDPREFRLCSFGGAGGLHVCALAEELGMHKALVPIQGGVLSALGMLVAPASREYSRAILKPLTGISQALLSDCFETMILTGHQELVAEGYEQAGLNSHLSVDLRYQGQTATLNIPWENAGQAAQAFSALHAERYRHRLELPVELVNLRVSVRATPPDPRLPEWPMGQAALPVIHCHVHGVDAPVPVYQRNQLGRGQILAGPALIIESNATTWTHRGWSVEVDRYGNLLLEREGRVN